MFPCSTRRPPRGARSATPSGLTWPSPNACPATAASTLGFALENFDPVGAWRTEARSKDGGKTFPIDTAGVMPDGERHFRDAREMKQLMAADRGAMLHGFTEALMTYSLGRAVGFSDQPLVEEIVSEVERRNYGARSLLHAIVLSDAFRSK